MFNTNAQCYQNISQVLLTSAFILWPTCSLRYSGKNPMRFAVFWRISVRFCGFRTPLTPPSIIVKFLLKITSLRIQSDCFDSAQQIVPWVPEFSFSRATRSFGGHRPTRLRPKAEDTSGEAARKTSGAERPDLQCYMGLDLVSNLSIKPAVARLIS